MCINSRELHRLGFGGPGHVGGGGDPLALALPPIQLQLLKMVSIRQFDLDDGSLSTSTPTRHTFARESNRKI